jgi:hypothetical protein
MKYRIAFKTCSGTETIESDSLRAAYRILCNTVNQRYVNVFSILLYRDCFLDWSTSLRMQNLNYRRFRRVAV